MSVPDLSNDVRRTIALDPPRYRGVLHSWCVPLSVAALVGVTLLAPPGYHRVLVAVYGLSVVLMFAFSALFHRVRWTDKGWWLMRKLDQTGIYLIIAGSFTGVVGLTLTGTSMKVTLATVWIVVALGIAHCWLPSVPRFGLMTSLFIGVGALAIPILPDLLDALGVPAMLLLLSGCAVYVLGAFCLGARVPDPWPAVFGYHEIWHVLVVVAAGMHYFVVALFALPVAEANMLAVAVMLGGT